jgi:hypothetical protein
MGDHGCFFTDVQCLHRWNKVLKPGLKKGAWTDEEDQIVHDLVQVHGVGKIKWSQVAEKLPGRIGKQCRERWFNHLDKQINKTEWDHEENIKLYECQVQHGNKWSAIAKMMPGRTENGKEMNVYIYMISICVSTLLFCFFHFHVKFRPFDHENISLSLSLSSLFCRTANK